MPYNSPKEVKFVGEGSTAFDGTGDYVTITDHADFSALNSGFSLACWVKVPDSSGTDMMFLKANDANTAGDGDNEWFFYLSSGKPLFQVMDDSASSEVGRYYNTALTVEKWYHLVAVYDGTAADNEESSCKIYVNGVQADDTNTETNGSDFVAIEDTSTAVTIGAHPAGGSAFKGSMKNACLLYTSPSPRDRTRSRMPSSA